MSLFGNFVFSRLKAALAPRGAAGDNLPGSHNTLRRLTLGHMLDYEGSRGEFLKLLAEFGEEPAFLARARAPQIALDALLQACETKRNDLLKWPNLHLAVLAQQIGRDWSRLGPFLVDPASVAILEAMHAAITQIERVQREWLVTDRIALRRFLESAARFNDSWRTYVDGLDLEPVNAPRKEFNRFYVLEKACAFGSERVTDGFEPLAMIDREYIFQRFPLLSLPRST